ncbi:protein DpdE [Mycolicibacterium nivoides]|uniref:protein DpdE n=1 Tax=Mycolicibacterium nivoides TaxID=2487344 RepID=UPI003C2E21D1
MTERMATRGANAGRVFLGCTRYPACKGSLSTTGTKSTRGRRTRKVAGPQPAGRKQSLSIGDLIVSSANDLGVGKAVARHGDRLTLEYFDNPGQPPDERFRAEVPMTGLRRFKLDQEVRVFWFKDDVWHSGRLEDINEHRDISVRSRGRSIFLQEKDVYIRWDRPLDDPVGFGEVCLMESPYLSDLRRPFMHHTLRQRSAAHGLGAALSSSIQLHAHQLDAARRVLEDPIQRYLLADEVGLGKTIEAGIVIRQILDDYPSSTVSLILPPFLINQWRRELATKFGIADFAVDRIRFARDDRPESWTPADLLVVDEAHNLARLRISDDDEMRKRYQNLTSIALQSPRLLLLSATPVLHNEDIFLGMLRLLDPSLYGQATSDDLRKRVAMRTELARSLLGLKPSLPPSVISRRLNDLRAMLVADDQVKSLIAAVEIAVGQDKSALPDTIDALQAHVADVYRVHRRMIRTRRTEDLFQKYSVQGRSTPTSLPLNSTLLRAASALIDEWRQYALGSVEVGGLDVATAAALLANACAVLLDPAALATWARRRSEDASTQDEASVLRRLADTMEHADRNAEITLRVAEFVTGVVTIHERAVVFCPTPTLAMEVGAALEKHMGQRAVCLHIADSDPATLDELIRSFESKDASNRILVSDRSAEEGRNFQFADVVIHVGLPSDVNRLEQRIGRSDRWSKDSDPTPARSYLVTSGEDAGQWDTAWFQVVRDGFEVFTKSIASLQHAVDSNSSRSWQQFVRQGTDVAAPLADEVRDRLAEELDNVREQDALDSREARIDARSIYSQVTAAEAAEGDFGEKTDQLLARDGRPGSIRMKCVGTPTIGAGSYSITPDRRAEPPLIPLWRIRRDFVRLEGQTGTFRRDVAVHRPGVRLYRYGSPFIDAVSDFIWNDDRGRCFGMWRYDSNWQDEDLIAYRFDYHVEADLPEATALAASEADRSKALHRRADAIFPPAVETVWIGIDGMAIVDPAIVDVLERRYRKPNATQANGDLNLNPTRLQAAYRVLPQSVWKESWRAAEAAARQTIVQLDRFVERVDAGLESCAHDGQMRQRQLALRETYSEGPERAELRREREMEDAMTSTLDKAIRTPRLGLDSTGIVIVAGHPLEDQAE